jgi:hypothetical protein
LRPKSKPIPAEPVDCAWLSSRYEERNCDESNRDPWCRDRRHDDGQPVGPRAPRRRLARHRGRSRRPSRLPAGALVPAVRHVPRGGHGEEAQEPARPQGRAAPRRDRSRGARRAARRDPGGRREAALRRADRGDRVAHPAGADAGPHRRRLARDCVRLLHARGRLGLRDKLDAFQGGRLVVNVVEMPIKCPVAPLEFLFLADAYFTERGMRTRSRSSTPPRSRGRSPSPRLAGARRDARAARHRGDRRLLAREVDGEQTGAQGLRRPRDRLRPARDHPAARRRRGHRGAPDGRRGRLAPDRQAHAAERSR